MIGDWVRLFILQAKLGKNTKNLLLSKKHTKAYRQNTPAPQLSKHFSMKHL